MWQSHCAAPHFVHSCFLQTAVCFGEKTHTRIARTLSQVGNMSNNAREHFKAHSSSYYLFYIVIYYILDCTMQNIVIEKWEIVKSVCVIEKIVEDS